MNLASPAYLKLWGTPHNLDDLQTHFLVQYASNFGANSNHKVTGFEYQLQGKIQYLKMKGKLSVNNSDAYQAACLAGFGIVQAPQLGAQHLIDQGQLVAILPELRAPSMPVSMLYPDRRHLAKRTQKFMEWVAATLAPHLQSVPD
jgi:DNA-binding transcriptional LysR family regulator